MVALTCMAWYGMTWLTGKWRVNGPMSNLKGFADTYKCDAKSRMGRSLTDSKCTIW